MCIAGSYPNTLSDVNYYVGIGGSYPNTLSDVNCYVKNVLQIFIMLCCCYTFISQLTCSYIILL